MMGLLAATDAGAVLGKRGVRERVDFQAASVRKKLETDVIEEIPVKPAQVGHENDVALACPHGVL
jgi:hypothetical protein